uniref:NADPH:quinone oxidoreductase n=1 Tax=Rhizophora mucronata TaxID=61149 RepID=A0A2P2MII7_RHIMU
MKVEINTNLAKMILRSPTAKTSSSTYNGSSFVSPTVWRPRCPVNGIFQRCWQNKEKQKYYWIKRFNL